METIEQEKFLRNMPKALDDRIVQQVGRFDKSFQARQKIMMNTRHMINIILLQVDYVVQVPNLARAIAAEHLLQVFQDLFLAPTKPLILVVLPTKDASGVSAKLKSPLTGLPHPRS